MARPLFLIWLVILLWLGLSQYATGQSDARLESRLNQLESDLGRLRTQVNRLEYQRVNPNHPAVPPLPTAPPTGVEPSMEEQFDRLATLTVELKQELRQIENRVTQLEAVIRPNHHPPTQGRMH